MHKSTLILLFLVLFTFPILVSGQGKMYHPTAVRKAVYFDVSPPLRDMKIVMPAKKGETLKEVPNKITFWDYKNIKPHPFGLPEDPVWQKQDGIYLPASYSPIQNFEGIANISGVYPPDPQGDIGLDKYVQVVNSNFAVYSKTGTLLYGPYALSTIWAGVGPPWEGTNNGDPIVIYDQAADRWLISQFSLPDYPTGTENAEMIAVSQTSDPTGSWYRYIWVFGSSMPDYPKFGVWPDAYYMSANQFINNATTWGGVAACALERTKMLSGDPSALMLWYDLGPSEDPWSMLPSDWDGTITPVTGEPNYFVYADDYTLPPDEYLKVWEFHVDFATPGNSTFGETYSLLTAPFNSTICGATRGRCIPQPGTSVKLESLSDRLMFRLQYRNFGGYRAMVTNHTVNVDGAGHAGIRWYELRNSGSGWSIYQQGTYAPDASHRWMGSVALNANGYMALGYSVSDASSVYPSIRYTGRMAGDPLGTMTISEQIVIPGTGSQTGTACRWGDYSMMSVDPSDDATFWYTDEYILNTGTANWQTRIASFKFDNSPTVVTLPASGVTTSTATLNGTVNPNGLATNYHFEWGTTTGYGNSTSTLSAGSGTSNVSVSAGITGLTPGVTYHFRLVATNIDGTRYGNDVTFTTLCTIITSFPWTEGFENGGLIPPCWTQEQVSNSGIYWTFITGNGASHPVSAHNGTYNACLKDASSADNRTKLITPAFNLSLLSNPQLKFWHTQELWSPDQDQLKVYYKTSAGGAWNLLGTWLTSIATWTQETIDLPNASSEFYIAFEGNAKWGWGVCIDDVQISGKYYNRELTNMTIGYQTSVCYDAVQTILVAGGGTNFTVQNGGSATLIAGQNIRLLPGTVVQYGGYLWAYISAQQSCPTPTMPETGPLAIPEEILVNGTGTNFFRVYPNPTTGKFTLELLTGEELSNPTMTIFGMLGEAVMKANLGGSTKTEFSLAERPTGIYIIRVTAGNRTGMVKIIKQE